MALLVCGQLAVVLAATVYLVPASAFAQETQYSTVVPERSYADPLTGDFVSNGVITPLDQEMRGGLLGEPVGRQLARAVLDLLGRSDEALSPHSLTANDLNPNRQRAATKGMDVEDLLDLLNNDERLRKYNSSVQSGEQN